MRPAPSIAAMQVNLHDAKTHLSRYVDQALAGEEVVIARGRVEFTSGLLGREVALLPLLPFKWLVLPKPLPRHDNRRADLRCRARYGEVARNCHPGPGCPRDLKADFKEEIEEMFYGE